MQRYPWIWIFASVLLSSHARAQSTGNVVVDMRAENFAANDQQFGRLMQGALDQKKAVMFGNGSMILGTPGEDAFTIMLEGVGNLPVAEGISPLDLSLALHGGMQLFTLPRPSTNDLMGGRTPCSYGLGGPCYSFPSGSLAFTTSDSLSGMTFFAGAGIFSADGSSYVLGGFLYTLEFEDVSGRSSPYFFTSFEIIKHLTTFFNTALSASESARFSRVGGGVNYRFEDLIPPVLGRRGDLQAGFYYSNLRQILSNQKNFAITAEWFPLPVRDLDEGNRDYVDVDKLLESETVLRLYIGRLSTEYDYRDEDDSGLFWRLEGVARGFVLGINRVPGSLIMGEPGKGLWGWKVGLALGSIFTVTAQRNFLVDGGMAPLVGTTFGITTAF